MSSVLSCIIEGDVLDDSALFVVVEVVATGKFVRGAVGFVMEEIF